MIWVGCVYLRFILSIWVYLCWYLDVVVGLIWGGWFVWFSWWCYVWLVLLCSCICGGFGGMDWECWFGYVWWGGICGYVLLGRFVWLNDVVWFLLWELGWFIGRCGCWCVGFGVVIFWSCVWLVICLLLDWLVFCWLLWCWLIWLCGWVMCVIVVFVWLGCGRCCWYILLGFGLLFCDDCGG